MGKETLTLDTMGDIDVGALRIAVNNALKLLTQDLHDRPTLDKKRTLMLRLDLVPVVDVNTSTPVLDGVDAAWQVMTKSPAIGASGVQMKPQHNGLLSFRSEFPHDNPEDEDLEDEAKRVRRERRKENPDGQ